MRKKTDVTAAWTRLIEIFNPSDLEIGPVDASYLPEADSLVKIVARALTTGRPPQGFDATLFADMRDALKS